jgi:endoglucanase
MINNKNSLDTIKDMGIGYNLGNTFDCYDYDIVEMNTPEEQIILKGNTLPTKNMIQKLKKYGFKTIRFPVTWIYFIDNEGNINSDWMSLVKEVIDLIIKEELYCILNIHKDGYFENWLSWGIEAKDKFINLWTQIANEFKDYNNYLIFESMNEAYLYDSETYNYDYDTLLKLNQAFVDTIRNSGGNNIKRLLIVAGALNDLDMTCLSEYKIPVDPSNKLALSLNYFIPLLFTKELYFEPYNWTIDDGFEITYEPTLNWGNQEEYFQIISDFDLMKNKLVNKGIPVIITEVGVLTEEKKNLESIREYLYMIFSITSDYDGIMSCLWDTSNKEYGDMNFYDREKDIWYDDKIKKNFLQISRGKYIKPIDFYIKTNFENKTNPNFLEDLTIKIGTTRKALKIILNVRLNGILFIDLDFKIYSFDLFGRNFEINFGKSNGKKQYDGTYVFTIDVSKIKCYEYIQIAKHYGKQLITLNNITIEFEESFKTIDYKSYKAAISNNIY